MSSSLHMLREHAESARDAAQAALQRAVSDLRGAEAQGEQLAQYRDDYQQRYREQFSRSASIEILRHYQSFVTRLAQAIEHQARVIEQQRRRIEATRAAAVEAETRLAAIGKLIERRLAERDRQLARREQRMTDEQAARAARSASQRFGSLAGMSSSFEPT